MKRIFTDNATLVEKYYYVDPIVVQVKENSPKGEFKIQLRCEYQAIDFSYHILSEGSYLIEEVIKENKLEIDGYYTRKEKDKIIRRLNKLARKNNYDNYESWLFDHGYILEVAKVVKSK